MIRVESLTKRYGDKIAVDDLTFDVRPGLVTGFLGPNGAGKSTTMRMILGLDRPTKGRATIAGRAFTDQRDGLHLVGALLDAGEVQGDRRAVAHLTAAAATIGLGRRRVDEVLTQVGLADVAHQRISSYSLGMRQRLGIAVALLGDPPVVMLDEPINGLDPDGVDVDPPPAAVPGRRGPHRLRLLPPDVRGVPGRRPPRRHRPRAPRGRRAHA